MSIKVLIVDDNDDNRDLIKRSLVKDGYEILEARDGPEALEAVIAEKPGLIILDILMPGMTGYEVCEKIRSGQDCADTPILFLSARHAETAKRSALDAGGDEFITKPFSPKELRSTVKKLVGGLGGM